MKTPEPKPLEIDQNKDSDFCGGVMYSIHQVYFSIHKHLEYVLGKECQVSFSQFIILIGFSNKDYPTPTQAKLAEQLLLTEATVSRHISSLVTKKILKKIKDPSNKKSYKLSLTPLGSQVYTKTKNIILRELDIYFSSIKEKDKKIIIENFKRITSAINDKRKVKVTK